MGSSRLLTSLAGSGTGFRACRSPESQKVTNPEQHTESCARMTNQAEGSRHSPHKDPRVKLTLALARIQASGVWPHPLCPYCTMFVPKQHGR